MYYALPVIETWLRDCSHQS